jgi:hypothetical protein
MKKKNIGSTLDSFLREEGLYERVSAAAIKRVVARQVKAAKQTIPSRVERDPNSAANLKNGS